MGPCSRHAPAPLRRPLLKTTKSTNWLLFFVLPSSSSYTVQACFSEKLQLLGNPLPAFPRRESAAPSGDFLLSRREPSARHRWFGLVHKLLNGSLRSIQIGKRKLSQWPSCVCLSSRWYLALNPARAYIHFPAVEDFRNIQGLEVVIGKEATNASIEYRDAERTLYALSVSDVGDHVTLADVAAVLPNDNGRAWTGGSHQHCPGVVVDSSII